MEESPDGMISVIPDEAKELLKNPYHRRNIVFHIDSGESCGGEMIPYDDSVDFDELLELYENYFLHNDKNNFF